MQTDFYRFERKTEEASTSKGSTNSYFIRNQDLTLLAYCLVKGRCITHPTVFRTSPEAESWFRMDAKRKVLNMTYFLFEPGTSKPFATITCRGKGCWRILDATDREACYFADGSTWADTTGQVLLGGSPDRYLVISERSALAHIRMEPRPEPGQPAENQGFLKRALKAFLRKSDWVMTLEPSAVNLDHRLLIAGMILLIEHTISMARSN